MSYLKICIGCILFSSIMASGFLISYYDIQYSNLIFIAIPILLIIFFYFLFFKTGFQGFDFTLASIPLYYWLSLLIILACSALKAREFNFNDLFAIDFASIRSDFIEKDVTLADQLIPLIVVYPWIHAFYLFDKKDVRSNLKAVVLFFGLFFLGFTTGGRQIFFQIIIVILVLKGAMIFKSARSWLLIGLFVFAGAIVTIGRFDNPDVSKAQLLENLLPANVGKSLTMETKYPAVQEIALEISFYFGHQIPAFCNKIENLDIKLFPAYPFGMQPFFERQLSRMGVLSYTQNERYFKLLNLSNNSGFFEVSWSTGFLDIYFNIGYFGMIFFCLLLAFCFYNVKANLKHDPLSGRYRILNGMNILFVITMFMTPAFFDTTIFLAYTALFLFNFNE